jgi:eukaryotic-like serine/threonine-protein kinase
MASSEQVNSTEATPPDLLSLIRQSGVLDRREFKEVSSKVENGEYPHDSRALAGRLVAEGILTEFQASRLLLQKVHGLVMGRYVILDRLGAGARGRVFKAQHRLMGRVVALKVIAPQIATRASSIARFHREMRLIGRLDHPNVIRAFDADQIGASLYIIMEYVPGRSLDHVLDDRGPLPAAAVVNYMTQAACGLGHAHDRGIIHRDIKPSNLFLSEEGQVKVLDLGLSALMEADTAASFATAAGFVVGTLHYMSPEQCAGTDIDVRSDLFSLGCTMYHLLSGQVPFPGETVAECFAWRIQRGPVPITKLRPEVSPQIVQVLDKLLARRREDRFQTAAEAALALQGLTHLEVGGRPARDPTPHSPTDPRVPKPAGSSVASSAVHSPSTPSLEPPGARSSPWPAPVSILTAHPLAITFLMIVFELIVLGVGFALGHVFANLQ